MRWQTSLARLPIESRGIPGTQVRNIRSLWKLWSLLWKRYFSSSSAAGDGMTVLAMPSDSGVYQLFLYIDGSTSVKSQRSKVNYKSYISCLLYFSLFIWNIFYIPIDLVNNIVMSLLILITALTLMAFNSFFPNTSEKGEIGWGHLGLLFDALVALHLQSHLCVNALHKTIPQWTSHALGSMG